MTDRIDPDLLPWSQEAEQCVLGSLMLSQDPASLLAEANLEAGHFFDARHRVIWSAIAGMVARSQPADAVTVHARLQDQGQADKCGGLEYLTELTCCVASPSYSGAYAEIIVDKALRRAIVAAADQAQQLARAPGSLDGNAVLDRVSSLFGGIARTRANDAPKQLGELVAPRVDHWQSLADGTADPGIPTGLATLDEALGGGLKPGKVIVLAARPSVGKTSLAGHIGLKVAEARHGVLMLSQEMPAGDLVDRFAANLGGVSLGRLTTGKLEAEDWSMVSQATEAASRLPLFIDDRPALTLLDIRAKARQVQQRHGLDLLIVDYLQLCASTAAMDKRHHQIEQISRGMKQLSKELGICVLLLSQLKRDSGGEPELDHLKESGAIEEDADTVILLHPWGSEPDGSMTVLAKIPKNRQGRRGRLALSFHGKTQRWSHSSANVARRSSKDS